MLLDSFDAILSDLDGVVYAGPFAIEGAVESLNRSVEMGVPVAYVTNNASRSVETVAEHLQQLGVKTDADHVVSSAQAAARMLKEHLEPGDKVLVCGAQALADCLTEAGLTPAFSQQEKPRAVAQGFNPQITWENLAEAAYTLADPEVLWVASNTDFTIPKERGIAPGNGTLVGAVATATGRTPLVAGKPEAPIFATGAQKLGAVRPVVVGDRLDTDIQGGNRAGMPTALVMTGVDTFESVLAAVSLERPTYILNTLADFFLDYPEITVETSENSARAVLGSLQALAQGDTLTLRGEGTEIDRVRVACAAWWAAHPETETVLAPREFIRE